MNRIGIGHYISNVYETDIFEVIVIADGVNILGAKPYLLARLRFLSKGCDAKLRSRTTSDPFKPRSQHHD
jgi:hypothetical protein